MFPVMETGVKLAAIGDSCMWLEVLPGARKGSEEGLDRVSSQVSDLGYRLLFVLTANKVYRIRHHSTEHQRWIRSGLLNERLQGKTP